MRDVVPAALDGQRIDRVVAIMIDLSRSAVRRMVEHGEVLVDGEPRTSASSRVAEGSVIEVTGAVDIPVAAPPTASPHVEFSVVAVDDHVIVIDKPVGLVVHPGAGHVDDTLVNGLLAAYPDLAGIGDPMRPGIVHRLDRDTSGLLVCARSELAYASLVDQLSGRAVSRVYLTLVAGRAESPTGLIDAPIGRSRRSRTRMTVAEDGREARTEYEELEGFDEPIAASLLRCTLQTGRTHQIRVHLNAIGLPVLGDEIYGRPDPFGSTRPLLHATRLSFRHPADGTERHFESPPPADFESSLAGFRLAGSAAGR